MNKQASNKILSDLDLDFENIPLIDDISYSNNEVKEKIGLSNLKLKKNDYLKYSLINSMVCVFIGIPAVAFSLRARYLFRINKTKEAEENAKKAKIFNIYGICLGLFCISTLFISYFFINTYIFE